MSASMAEVLAEHQYAFSTRIETDLERRCRKDTKWCTCGFEVTVYVDELDRNECYDTSDRLRAKLAAHQAEVLVANGYGKLEGAWDEGLSAGQDRWLDSREFGDPPVNPYRRPE